MFVNSWLGQAWVDAVEKTRFEDLKIKVRAGRPPADAPAEAKVLIMGVVTRWERRRRQNHWLDALYIACAAAHGCGARLVDEQPVAPRRRQTTIRVPDRDSADGYTWIRPRPRW